MPETSYTPKQQEAVDTRDTAILVSAAAGSGKTSVLTGRLLKRIQEGENIDRFLVITFTRAAAAEMRGRILKGLTDLSREDPGNRHLSRQTALLYKAQIGTIDSFCTTVVRENAHLLGLPPTFRIADEERAQTMRRKALEDVLEKAYDNINTDAGLRSLVNTVGDGRDDQRLAEYILLIHDKMQSHARPRVWLREALQKMQAEGIEDAALTMWGEVLLTETKRQADYYTVQLERIIGDICASGDKKLETSYCDVLELLANIARNISSAADEGCWNTVREALDYTVPKLKGTKGVQAVDLRERAKTIIKDTKTTFDNFRSVFAPDNETALRDLRDSVAPMAALADLVLKLDNEYHSRKQQYDLCDFADVEHACIRLLCNDDDSPTELAQELSLRFSEVLVDEYQDVNAVQELIFRSVSNEGRRLFMVGDIKQSIYRFRLAEPGIFREKYNTFATREQNAEVPSDDDRGRLILLQQNFRSRSSVLAACNSVFEKIMSGELGEVDYDDNARLVYGAVNYPTAGDVKAELVLIDSNFNPHPAEECEEETAPESDDDDDNASPDIRMAEPRYVARRIRTMLDNCEKITERDGSVRPIRYGDIAILMRTPGTSAAPYYKALSEAGIPCAMDRGASFLMIPEVSFALEMLTVADNPRQDIPLVAAMSGTPFAFTPDELAQIRAEGQCDLWDALLKRAETDAHCRRFVDLIYELRAAAADEPTPQLLQRLYNETDLLAVCAALPDSDEHMAGLMRLYEYACRFEATDTRGLHRFTAWLAMLEENNMKQTGGSRPDCVRIMSIHKSKGLEFPVVFLVDNAHRFRLENSAQVLCHGDLCLGMKMTDNDRGVTWPTIAWRAISQRLNREERSEQQRVLYVAMTRARERLIMTGVMKNALKKRTDLEAHYDLHEGPIDPNELSGAGNTLEWLVRAAVCDRGKTIKLSVEGPQAEPEPIPLPEAAETKPSEADTQVLAERLSWTYPHAAVANLPSKLTVTEIKRMESLVDPDPETVRMTPETAPETEATQPQTTFRMPDFGAVDRPLTGAERGTAEHLVMQHIRFSETHSPAAIAGEIDRLRCGGVLTAKQASAVPPRDIFKFFDSKIGREVLSCPNVHREFRFSLLRPASTWFPDAPEGEDILLQGVIDCWLEYEDHITVIDFKTDAGFHPEYYTPQLSAYADALHRMTGKPVRRAVLWYLRYAKIADIPLVEM